MVIINLATIATLLIDEAEKPTLLGTQTSQGTTANGGWLSLTDRRAKGYPCHAVHPLMREQQGRRGKTRREEPMH